MREVIVHFTKPWPDSPEFRAATEGARENRTSQVRVGLALSFAYNLGPSTNSAGRMPLPSRQETLIKRTDASR